MSENPTADSADGGVTPGPLRDDMTEVVTTTKSPGLSTINWAQIAGVIASIAAIWKLNVTEDQILSVIVGIQTAVALYTVIRHTFFSVKVLTPAASYLEKV